MNVNIQLLTPAIDMAIGLGPWRNISAVTIIGMGPVKRIVSLRLKAVILRMTLQVNNHSEWSLLPALQAYSLHSADFVWSFATNT
jgi:hypothetical protein